MSHDPSVPGVAFLLSQVGAAAAARFAAALAELELTPPQAGLLRRLAGGPPSSQQELARDLGAAPSRLVSYLDDLEHRALVERRPGPDRRVNEVSLTADGRRLVQRLNRVARGHEQQITAGLSTQQRQELQALLSTVAGSLGVMAGVHPGYAGPVAGPRSARR